MLLANYLDAKAVLFVDHAANKEEIYHQMVSRLHGSADFRISTTELLKLILARDAESSTAYPTGIAIPHIRIEGIDDTLVSVCMLKDPLDYDGIDVTVIVLMITEKTASRLYLNLVSAFIQLSKDTLAMQELKRQKDAHQLISAIKRLGITIKASLHISDIMNCTPITIGPDKTLKELSDVLSNHGLTYLPVVDDEGKYLGEVDILNLLKVGVPDYLMMLDHLSFLDSYEPLENLLEQEDRMLVADIMRTDQEFLSPDSSIIEAAHEMIQGNKRYYSVVQNNVLAGVISATDIFTKVVRA